MFTNIVLTYGVLFDKIYAVNAKFGENIIYAEVSKWS